MIELPIEITEIANASYAKKYQNNDINKQWLNIQDGNIYIV